MATDVEQMVKRLRELGAFIATYPLPKEVRDTMTFRQFHELVRAKERELGVDQVELERLGDHPDIEYEQLMISMSFDELELLTESYHQDLPLNFPWMPEYRPMLDAEDKYFYEQPLDVPVDEGPMREIVAKFMPARGTS